MNLSVVYRKSLVKGQLLNSHTSSIARGLLYNYILYKRDIVNNYIVDRIVKHRLWRVKAVRT